MGLILGEKAEDSPVILTDILGLEDALGTMDFKVAGDATGITTFQLDIKSEGLTLATLESALMQAKRGRLHILGSSYPASLFICLFVYLLACLPTYLLAYLLAGLLACWLACWLAGLLAGFSNSNFTSHHISPQCIALQTR